MSASWFLVSTSLIWIFESTIILSNIETTAALWVRDTCLIVGLRPSMIILITSSLSSEDVQQSAEVRCVCYHGNVSRSVHFIHFSVTVSIRLALGLVCLLRVSLRTRFLDASLLTSSHDTFLDAWMFREECHTSITKSQSSKAEIPSMRKPPSRETTSHSIELCEIRSVTCTSYGNKRVTSTDVLFLAHPTFFGTNVRLPKRHKIHPKLILQEWETTQNGCKCAVHNG